MIGNQYFSVYVMYKNVKFKCTKKKLQQMKFINAYDAFS